MMPVPLPTSMRGNVPIHEAGHLVVARALGLPVKGAVINRDGSGQVFMADDPLIMDRSHLQDPKYSQSLAQAFTSDDFALVDPDFILDYSVMMMAGTQAEMLASDLDFPVLTYLDRKDHDHRCTQFLLSMTRQRLAIGWCQRRARFLLDSNWDEVEYVAARLDLAGIYYEPKGAYQ